MCADALAKIAPCRKDNVGSGKGCAGMLMYSNNPGLSLRWAPSLHRHEADHQTWIVQSEASHQGYMSSLSRKSWSHGNHIVFALTTDLALFMLM